MANYTKINWKEYCNLGKINTFATYDAKDFFKSFLKKVSSDKRINFVVINTDEELQNELMTNHLYPICNLFFKGETTDINNIINRCYELKKKLEYFAVIVYLERSDYFSKKELKLLKKCSNELYPCTFLFITNLQKKYPTKNDVGNAYLTNMSNVIVLSSDESYDDIILAKNKYGKTGILTK